MDMQLQKLGVGFLLVFLMSISVASAYPGDSRYYEDYQRDYYFDETNTFSRSIEVDYDDPYYYGNSYYSGYPYSYGYPAYRSGFSDRETFSSTISFERHDRYTREFRTDVDYYQPYNRYGYNNYGGRYDRYAYRDPYYYGNSYDYFGSGVPRYNYQYYY